MSTEQIIDQLRALEKEANMLKAIGDLYVEKAEALQNNCRMAREKLEGVSTSSAVSASNVQKLAAEFIAKRRARQNQTKPN